MLPLLTWTILLLAPVQEDTPTTPPSRYHGNWRVTAADDRHGQAVMRVDIQHSPGQREGTGAYALYQPFCDLVAERPITGDAQCELIGQGGELTVTQGGRNIVLAFTPTADGLPHRLTLRVSGKTLVGTYRVADYRRAVRLTRVPE